MFFRKLPCDIDATVLDERLEREVEKSGIKSSSNILLTSSHQLRKSANFTEGDISILKDLAASTLLLKGFLSVNQAHSEFTRRWKTICLDCPGIDTTLRGGIPVRGITELYGVSGAGKTQFCLQWSITVQYPEELGGLNAGCVYICTEDRFPSRRLQSLFPHFPREDNLNADFLKNASDSIFVDHIPDVESLKECLFKRLPLLLQNLRIGLLIIDSIAAIFRADYTITESFDRSKDIRIVGSQLHKLSSHHNLAVLCVNQLMDSLETNETLPALGLTWANLVTTKCRLQILPDNRRSFSVVSSPELPQSSQLFKVTSKGIEDLSSADSTNN